MTELIQTIANYIYVLGAIALILEYTVPKRAGDALILKMIDFSDAITTSKVDGLIRKVARYWLEKYDAIYGSTYFGLREWAVSIGIAFTYCFAFHHAENSIGFNSSLVKQLKFWFVPNLLADIISLNFTRILLKKIFDSPRSCFLYLFYDLIVVILCYYISFSVTIGYLMANSLGHLGLERILLHPFHMASIAFRNFPDMIALDALLVNLMALTTLLPTLLYLIFLLTSILLKYIVPAINLFTNNLIEKMISFDRHPLAVATIVVGIFFLPFIVIFHFML
jgi:hypothetical protein